MLSKTRINQNTIAFTPELAQNKIVSQTKKRLWDLWKLISKQHPQEIHKPSKWNTCMWILRISKNKTLAEIKTVLADFWTECGAGKVTNCCKLIPAFEHKARVKLVSSVLLKQTERDDSKWKDTKLGQKLAEWEISNDENRIQISDLAMTDRRLKVNRRKNQKGSAKHTNWKTAKKKWTLSAPMTWKWWMIQKEACTTADFISQLTKAYTAAEVISQLINRMKRLNWWDNAVVTTQQQKSAQAYTVSSYIYSQMMLPARDCSELANWMSQADKK